jgi:hypothetical protein
MKVLAQLVICCVTLDMLLLISGPQGLLPHLSYEGLDLVGFQGQRRPLTIVHLGLVEAAL